MSYVLIVVSITFVQCRSCALAIRGFAIARPVRGGRAKKQHGWGSRSFCNAVFAPEKPAHTHRVQIYMQLSLQYDKGYGYSEGEGYPGIMNEDGGVSLWARRGGAGRFVSSGLRGRCLQDSVSGKGMSVGGNGGTCRWSRRSRTSGGWL